MPSINKIRLTNVVYEEGNKRYNDELFLFGGYNSAILLENGGGKTVFIQTVLQAIIPHTNLADRHIKNTLVLENAPAHIAIEWLINEQPRRYVVTAVTLFMTQDGLDSLRYVYEYEEGDKNGIEGIPFVKEGKDGRRPAERGEMQDYYNSMKERTFKAATFATIKDFRKFIEEQYHIIADEWDSIVKINSTEGGVETFFETCKTTNQLFDRLLIPTVENSIAGHNPNLFAEMFEKQHHSLKQYKKLKETIEENKRIQEELEKYVQTFEKLHQGNLEYEKAKQRAKGVWEAVQTGKAETKEEIGAIKKRLAEWENKLFQHKIKKASYQIGLERLRYEVLDKEYEMVNGKYDELNEEYEKLLTYYFSLIYAKLKAERHQFEGEAAFAEAEMEKLNESEDLQAIEERLEKEKRALLGYFLEQIEKIEKERQFLEYELNPIEGQIEKIQHDIRQYGERLQTKGNDLARLKSMIETRRKDMDKLEQLLLANPKQEKVEAKMGEWERRCQFLDEEIIRLGAQKRNIEKEHAELEQTIETKKETKMGYANALANIQTEKERIDKEQSAVIKELGRLRSQWSSLDSVYENESSIFSRLHEMIEKLNKEKEELFVKERIAYRLVDDYGGQQTFFGDPVIASRLKTWKNQLDYCVTGIEYLQMLNDTDFQEKSGYPLWPVTLITTNKSKAAFEEKLGEITGQLRYPIQIMTTEEAAMINKETVNNEYSWIVPSHWKSGIIPELFEQWKEEISKEANEATVLRDKKEKEIKKWEQGLLSFQQFIEKHPYEKITDLQTEQAEIMMKLEEVNRSINHLLDRKEELKNTGKKIDATISDYREEKQGLEGKIEKGIDYLKYSQEVSEGENLEKQLMKEIEGIEIKLNRWKNKLDRFLEEKNSLSNRILELRTNLRFLKDDEQYKDVKALIPRFTGESKKVIQEKIRTAEMKLQQISVSYGELNEKLKNARNNIRRINDEMARLKIEHGKLDENMDFPSDGAELLEKMNEELKELKEDINEQHKLVMEKLSAKDEQKGRWKTSLERFDREFPDQELIVFAEPFEKVELDLKKEYKSLSEEKTFLDAQLERNKSELNSIDEAEKTLFRFIEKHHFNAPHIEPILLSNEEKVQFSYNRKKFSKEAVQYLEERKGETDKRENEVSRQKQAFKQFCLTITDIKMRRMAENGIEFKETYDELLEFKQNMMISVDRATNYANEHIRKKDEELQAFINQIHAHLQTVAEELKQIPKKTRVKVGDAWKTIYHFSIPEWEEEEGKTRIRDHIEWIMNQLESDRYLKEDGRQDEEKIRKDLEMWLQSKQLLQKVMNNEQMKVSCRKVTNENKVTTRSYSWEQSNAWSGGEKWSKNMTLFLGLLNYVAEKKDHIPKNLKRHRAVILDNPFGKASSDHVLNPVFFIAEQLGFQIIALTAHAEGKFLQDYFPVIYSLRLRSARDAGKQVMTKEKWLHSAYFQDHEPETLERLAETEQMSLF